MKALPKSILALDVGSKRVGVAVASLAARLPRPLTTLTHDDHFWRHLQRLITEEAALAIVVGLPRGLRGQTTKQTTFVTNFVKSLKIQVNLPVYLQDEAVTSVRATDELESRAKPYNKGDVDALAATFILEDFLGEKGDERTYEEL